MIEVYGSYNSYFFYNVFCKFYFINDESMGMIVFYFEGVLLMNEDDIKSECCDLCVELVWEMCDWLFELFVGWFVELVL